MYEMIESRVWMELSNSLRQFISSGKIQTSLMIHLAEKEREREEEERKERERLRAEEKRLKREKRKIKREKRMKKGGKKGGAGEVQLFGL